MRLLALFPLPLVLFPGAPLPLHIFEPRYRAMVADSLKGDLCFGLIYHDGASSDRPIPVGHVGCIAEIAETQPLADGRSNIVVRGTDRFSVTRHVPRDTLYGLAEVAPYGDDAEDDAFLVPAATRVRTLVERVARAAHALSDARTSLPELPADPAMLSFVAAGLSDLGLADRQSLLASRSASWRLAVVERFYERTAVTYERRAAVHAQAKSNGRGHGAPAL